MNVHFITVTFLYVVSDFVVLLQSTKDDQHKPSTSTVNDFAPAMDKWETNPDLKSLWLFRPPSIQSQLPDEQLTHRVVLRQPHIITKLAKPLSYGFDPFFRKPYFEPFERRQKPVTLVGFRKNGILPRNAVDPSIPLSSEVAELQSSFNDISKFGKMTPRFLICKLGYIRFKFILFLIICILFYSVNFLLLFKLRTPNNVDNITNIISYA